MEMRSVNVSSRANNSNTGMINSTNNMPGNVPVTRVVSGNALANMVKEVFLQVILLMFAIQP